MIEDISKQIEDMIKPVADLGEMLPKSAKDIEVRIKEGKGFYIQQDGFVVAFAALYEWPRYLEIGSVITRKEYRGKGFAKKVIKLTIETAKGIGGKPIIALTNKKSTKLFESLGFRYQDKTVEGKVFWEPCKKTCVDYGRWPDCHCHFMQFDK